MTVKLDISALLTSGKPLYPAMLHAIATVVNHHEEFRTALDEHGVLGIYDVLYPFYTIFHKESETFSNLWTQYDPSYERFAALYAVDQKRYSTVEGFSAKPDCPPNVFPVSMVPWEHFESFHLHLQKGYDYLLPIFTMGRFKMEQEQVLLPLAVQAHHAVCDGFHVCRFLDELRTYIKKA